jgi:hypothetical protein
MNDDGNYDFSHFFTYKFSCIQFRNATLGLKNIYSLQK